jgi:hypothetical protein
MPLSDKTMEFKGFPPGTELATVLFRRTAVGLTQPYNRVREIKVAPSRLYPEVVWKMLMNWITESFYMNSASV